MTVWITMSNVVESAVCSLRKKISVPNPGRRALFTRGMDWE